MEFSVPFLYLGFFLALTFYHFFVYIGRKEDIRNLSYSFFTISIALMIVSYRILIKIDSINPQFSNITGSFSIVCFAGSIAFFAHTIFNLKSIKFFTIIFFLFLIFSFIIFSIFYIYTNKMIFIHLFRGVAISNANISIILITYQAIRNKEYKERKKLLIGISYIIGIVSIIIGTIFSFISPDYYGIFSQKILLFPFSSFLLMVIIFAYVLTKSFNKEHKDLEILSKELENKVTERTIELERAKKYAEKTNERVTDYFINFAHETKTPLTLIDNYLNKDIENRGKSGAINIIKQNINKLKRNMINFLDIEKLKRGQPFYNHNQIINLSEIMKNKILLFKEIANQKKIKITSNLTDLIYIKIDPFAVDRILNNIIDNAINYSQKNGIIDISLESKGNSIIFTTKDNGIGISEKQLKNIFKPFYQISHEKRNIQGIGLGLNIVKKIIDEVNGEINVISKKNEGTIFEIKLDRYFLKENDKVNENIKISQPMKRFAQINKTNNKTIEKLKNILVVEDNIDMLNYLQTSLNETFNVYTARNGEQALETLKNIEKLDTIISDIMMDEMDGYEFYNQLLKNEYYKHIPFIFLTAKTSSKEKVFSLKKGAIDFITKPFNIDELIAKINSIIKVQDALTEYSLNKLGNNLYNILENINQLKNQKLNIKSLRNNEEDIIQRIYAEYSISRREIEIISLLKNGLEHKEIADKLGISIYTVKSFIRRIYKKCRVNNKIDLINLLKIKDN